MIAYVDSSVLLRRLFGEPEPLVEWPGIREAYSSRLLLLEVARVIDRARLEGRIGDEEVVQLHDEARRAARSIQFFSVNDGIWNRASRPMPTVLGSLDAIHLATALELFEEVGPALVLATHDVQLGRAARACGLDVRGV